VIHVFARAVHGLATSKWIRSTGLSQIGLGLSLFKFLEAMKTHRGYGLALIVIVLGTVGTIFGIVDYVATIKRMNKTYGSHVPLLHYQIVMASLIATFGTLVFVMLFAGWLW